MTSKKIVSTNTDLNSLSDLVLEVGPLTCVEEEFYRVSRNISPVTPIGKGYLCHEERGVLPQYGPKTYTKKYHK